MKTKIIKLSEGRWVVQVKLFGLFKMYVDNSDPIRFGTWPKSSIGNAICSSRERAEKMRDLYLIRKAL